MSTFSRTKRALPGRARFKNPTGNTLVDFLGTGAHACVPPSVWEKGERREIREWHRFDEPAVVDCRELFHCVSRLAAAHGWIERQKPKRHRVESKIVLPPQSQPRKVVVPEQMPIARGEPVRQARAYIANMPEAVQGRGGDSRTFRVACILIIDFGLSVDEALPLMLEYNKRCLPPWPVDFLIHKLEMAAQLPDPRGGKVRSTSRKVIVSIQSNDTIIYVGVGCQAPGRSYVDLFPNLFTGIIKLNKDRILAPELDAIQWMDKKVLLTPTSCIETNQQETWAEFFLAKLLRERGAEVMSIHLSSLNGRRRTFSQADGSEALLSPPWQAWETKAQAEAAKRTAKEFDPVRKALPRKKRSTRLEKAVAFIRENGVKSLTKDVTTAAKKKGISRTTLRRGLEYSLLLTPPTISTVF
jgi:hypothetical protein